ncbi:hypothetical protein ABN028_21850 [Actinopolymorpha sp. B17G11]|uniref:zinc finger domain-containing protein n=1 Tax=unclassified Actinopolymorpha TaxID=2627063 RepID=UPI0032D8E4D7
MADRQVPGVHAFRDRVGDGCFPVDPLDSGLLDWIWSGRLKDQGYTDVDLNTTARVLSLVCPTCSADIGEWCHTAAGNILAHLDLQHVARRGLIQRTTELSSRCREPRRWP